MISTKDAVEGKIGLGNWRFRLGLIRETLPATQGSTIAVNVLVMNLEKLLKLLFVIFASWLDLLLSNQPDKRSRFARPGTQFSLA
ncbi:hypothetical protein [Synechococcus sp. NB0720_010]|uniref:hypothetical protein n=1 Tax=Synechococcus sp. NB0720_010 TaxID=2907159 RepID=UPI001FF9E667|nr:hypothetical protein [Synechococcus sp. NB0720_010]UPH89136.1 hypothetical protein LY254_07385 [Synechococcus sp. NB0720_010]